MKLKTVLLTAMFTVTASATSFADTYVEVNPYNIQHVIDNCNDSESNKVTLKLSDGVYNPIHTNKQKESYINLIGGDNVYIVSSAGTYDKPAAELRLNGVVENINFISKHPEGVSNTEDKGAYAVHVDYGTQHTKFKNCVFESYQTAAVGAGITSTSKLSFENCLFKNLSDKTFGYNYALGSIYAHTDVLDNNTSGAKLELIDCKYEAPDFAYAYVVTQELNGAKMDVIKS